MIVVALNNELILNKIKEKYASDVYDQDITYMEGVIEFLSKNASKENIVITKDNLNGNLSKEMYIKQLKLADENVKIVLLTEKLDEAYRKFLFANEIFNIIEGDKIDIEKIIESINTKDKVIYKKSEISNVSRVLPKHFIAVYGTSGSGKSYIASNLAKIMSKDIKMNVAYLDMDLENPASDIYNNLNGAGNILTNIVEDIDRGLDINDILDNRLFRLSEANNISYITNNSSVYECQNKFSSYYYEKIYAAINNRYDSLVVDLPASPFIDIVQYTLSVASKIYFVVNPNYISVRQAGKYLELMTKLWQVPKCNIVIIVNKFQKSSLDRYQLESFFSDYKILDWVNYSANVEGYVNGINFNMEYNLNKEALYRDLGVVEVKSRNKNFFSVLLDKVEKRQ